jgi:hypothetical protein
MRKCRSVHPPTFGAARTRLEVVGQKATPLKAWLATAEHSESTNVRSYYLIARHLAMGIEFPLGICPGTTSPIAYMTMLSSAPRTVSF